LTLIVHPALIAALADAWAIRTFVHPTFIHGLQLFCTQFSFSILALSLLVLAGWGLRTLLVRLGSTRARLFALVTGAAAAALLGWAAFSGPMLARLQLRVPLITVSVLTGAVLGFVSAPVIRAPKRLSQTHKSLALATAVLVGCGAYTVHAFYFVRLYAALHFAAALLTLCCILSAISLADSIAPQRSLSRFAPRTQLALSLVLLALGCANFANSQRTQSELAQYSPIARYPALAIRRLARPTVSSTGLQDDRFVRGPSLDIEGLDIILVTVDALRWDRLGAYGAQRGLTPAIDQLASRGVVFERAYCTTPHTSYSLASIMTGKYFRPIASLQETQPPPRPHATLASTLRAQNYACAGFYPPAVFSVDGDRLGPLRTRHFDFGYHVEDYGSAAQRVQAAITWIDRTPRERKLFLWIHLFEPHESYERHPGARVVGSSSELSRYDAEVAAVDDAIAQLVAALSERHRRAAWIITADHGEEFGEHGGRFHGTTLYDEQVRVPLIVAVPGLPHRTVAALATHVDILPTLIGGLRLLRPPGLRGRDLGPEIDGATAPRPIFASVGSDRMVVQFPLKAICDVAASTCELYNLRLDPLERDNIADEQSSQANALRMLIASWDGSHRNFEREATNAGEPLTAAAHRARSTPAVIERGLQGDRSAADEIARLAPSLDAAGALEAIAALETLGVRSSAVFAALHSLRQRNATDVSLSANVAITRLGDAIGVSTCRRILGAQHPVTLRRRAALALASHGILEGLTTLREWVEASSATDAERDEVIAVLRAHPDGAQAALFEHLLPDPRLGVLAAEALGALGQDRSIAPLRQLVAQTPYVSTRTAALIALAKLHDPTAVSQLAHALSADNAAVELVTLTAAYAEAGLIARSAEIAVPARRTTRVTVPFSSHDQRPQGPHDGWLLVETTSSTAQSITLNGVRLSVSAQRQCQPVPVHNVRSFRALRVLASGALTIKVALLGQSAAP
jgi:arylsulfatase A-like enzyme